MEIDYLQKISHPTPENTSTRKFRARQLLAGLAVVTTLTSVVGANYERITEQASEIFHAEDPLFTGEQTYEVQANENLDEIILHNVIFAEGQLRAVRQYVEELNGIEDGIVYAGQKLTLPVQQID